MSRELGPPAQTPSARAVPVAIPTPNLSLVRTVLIALNLIGAASFLAELIFLRHFNEPLQYVAITAASLGVIGTLVAISKNTLARGFTLFAGVAMMLAGGVGFGIHLWRNHTYLPDQGVWGALTGPAPVMAPLALANIGLMLLVAVWLARTPQAR